MHEPNIIIEQATIQQFDERKRLRQSLDDSRGKASTLEQFASQISGQSIPQPLSPLSGEATPPSELQATLPALERSVAEIQRVETSIREQYAAIDEIKRKARNLKYTLIGSAGALFLILFFLLLHAVHVF